MTRRLIPAAVAVLATLAAPLMAIAQHGTPLDMRDIAPTIQDAAPGAMPGPEERIVPEAYRRQPVFYRSSEPVGTKVIVQQ